MRKWLQTLVDQFLPAVASLQDTPQGRAEALQWATWMRQQWVEHGLTELKQQRNLMTEVRNAIKQQLGEDHLALESMNFTVAEWTTMNTPIGEQVARRNENVVRLENPDAIVAQAVRLLESREWADVAAGLVVLTGRRSSEILGTAQFQPKLQWSVTFTGALKRRGEVQRLSFEIPTLTTAERVVKALEKLRQICPTEGLTAGQINQKYAQAVATACDRHFSDLVPNREGKDNLFTHLFRSVYAAIATLWYAPPTVDANEYKAAIQGHYAILEATDGTLKRSLAASRHYNDYKIGDLNGNIDGRQGIKLGYGGVEVIDVFNPDRRAKAEGVTSDRATTDLTNLHSDWTDSPVDSLDEAEDTAVAIQEVSQQAIEAVSEALEALPTVLRGEETEAVITPKRRMARRLKPVSVDLELLKSVASRFGIEVRGGKGQGYDHALLELLLVLEHNEIGLSDSVSHQPSATTSQTVADQAKTLAWLTGRVEGLEAQLAQVQQEKQDAISIAQQDERSQREQERLREENERLKTELQQTRSRLEGIQHFLTGGAAQSSATLKEEPIKENHRAHPDTEESSTAAIKASPSPQKSKDERPTQALPVQADLDPDVLKALQAILDYNDQTATSHAERWTISIPVMKDLLKQLGKATQPKIEAVLKAKSATIQQHHRLHGLGERHNRVHKGRSISEIIKL